MSCYSFYERPVLPDVAAAAQRHAALQSKPPLRPPARLTSIPHARLTTSAQIITIGDCSKVETQSFFRERLVPRIPPEYRPLVDFERLYEVFGGRLVHWQDYITDFGAHAPQVASSAHSLTQPRSRSRSRSQFQRAARRSAHLPSSQSRRAFFSFFLPSLTFER